MTIANLFTSHNIDFVEFPLGNSDVVSEMNGITKSLIKSKTRGGSTK